MKIRTQLHITAALVLTMSTGTLQSSDFIDLRRVKPVHGSVAAGADKATVCIACHGQNGNSTIPTFPRLSGQYIDYMYWRLVDYKRGTRPDSPMTAMVANLSDADLRDLAAFFAAQTPTANATPTAPSPAHGAALFQEGNPARGVPPCQGCHGTDARGLDDMRFSTWPALRGQHADYIVTRLIEFREGKHPTTSGNLIMQGVAHNLDDDDMRAIGAWLASLPPN